MMMIADTKIVGTIHVVDDDRMQRRALTRLLSGAGFCVQAYESAEGFMNEEVSSGCLLLDLDLPGTTGLQLQEYLGRMGNPIPIIFLTGHGDIPSSVRAIKAGAVDFLTKPVKKADLLPAICSALRRQEMLRSQHAIELETVRPLYNSLTSREQEVLHLLFDGGSNKDVANSLDISERTVKAHRAQIMFKMRANSFADLIRAVELLRNGQPPSR